MYLDSLLYFQYSTQVSQSLNTLHYALRQAPPLHTLSPLLLPYALKSLSQRLQSTLYQLTYRPLHSSQNVLVIGGSFTGVWTARRPTESLPSSYKVVLVEKNSHFNYTFTFPMYSVLRANEQKAFIPVSRSV
jgi:hypothetical protein